jgi:poly(beta-D-mannuronate) lyase
LPFLQAGKGLPAKHLYLSMRYIISWIFILSLSGQVYGWRTVVTTAAAISSGSWNAGDTIVMKNGTWTDQVISMKVNGTETQPIILEAETPGKVILNGNSHLAFSGKFIVVSGLYFLNGTLSGSDVIAFRTSSSELAENCRLTNTAIVNCNPPSNTVDNKWVSIYGKNNRVDHCSFENKTNSGTLLVVWLKSGVTANHVISENYFGYRNANLDEYGNEINGQEIIRIGDSGTSMTTAEVTVEGNYFEKCNGEIEVISNKSCGNIYTNNLFYECKGMLTLRHGNNCTVSGNYFFGNGISSTGGVRIIGENHQVYNNYFEKLRGTNYRSAICLVRGKENSLLNEYFQVKNALVAFNTMVDCSQSFSINYNSTSGMTLPPVGSVIAHNHVYNTTSSYNNVIIDPTNASVLDVTWKNNLMNQGKYTNFSYTDSEVITGKNAQMIIAGTPQNMYEPGSGSALLNYTTTEYNQVTTDIRGRDRRTTAKLPGASQISGTTTKVMPVKTNVGASFLSNPVSGLKPMSNADPLWITLANRKLTISSVDSRYIRIYNLSGVFITGKKLMCRETVSVDLKRGIYILQSVTPERTSFARKIAVL